MGVKNELIYPSLDKSLNYKEQILTGWNAVEIAIYSLLTRPMNSLPEIPTLGFDLHEFLFRDSTDSQIGELEQELSSKIQMVTKHSNIKCKVEVIGDNAYITIVYQKDDGSEMTLPITIEEGTNGRSILFKNIIVK